uniref:Uncharacterized protein n=1 Tax=Anguilla anguilla TaxID=7936 RepID=A0A0E9S220_ANGAN
MLCHFHKYSYNNVMIISIRMGTFLFILVI